jgi:hypothetical protein
MSSGTLDVAAMRGCWDGVIPPVLVTCSLDGRPNVAHVSQLHLVDESHIAVSNQYFSKTSANLEANPVASILVTDSISLDTFRLSVTFLRTETSGALFTELRATVEAIGAMFHMEDVFKLRGADVYRVDRCELVNGAR